MVDMTFRGPLCQLQHPTDINDGTLARVVSNPPAPSGVTPANSTITPVAQTSISKFVEPKVNGIVFLFSDSTPSVAFKRLRSSKWMWGAKKEGVLH